VALDDILHRFDEVSFSPRSLQIKYPTDVAESLSLDARAFFRIAHDKRETTALDFTSDEWTHDSQSRDFFFRCDEDSRTEILAFITLFIHEYTHRVDFLISPFGLQFYVNTLREYWVLQQLFPQALDDPRTLDKIRFLVALDENLDDEIHAQRLLKKDFESLKEIVHVSYAWGDMSHVKPLGRFIEEGWGDRRGELDPFHLGVPMEPVTVLGLFNTFRVPGGDKSWYLRPLTIFETKAVVNSLLFILHLLGDAGPEECLRYYEKIYLRRRSQLSPDYFFLLDLGAQIYELKDFHSLLKAQHPAMLRSTLITLSSICWYALQAPPPLKGDDGRYSNPIFRLSAAFMFMTAVLRGKIRAPAASTAEMLLALDGQKLSQALYVKPIKEVIPNCRTIIAHAIELNQQRTWNPEMKGHFDHVLRLMQPHFVERPLDHVSFMGMPDSGNPLFGCRTKEDWELTYDDYDPPDAVHEWFDIRSDLMFSMLKPADDVIERLDKHFMAFFVGYECECGTMVSGWASRFFVEVDFTCRCGQVRKVRRDDSTVIAMPRKDD